MFQLRETASERARMYIRWWWLSEAGPQEKWVIPRSLCVCVCCSAVPTHRGSILSLSGSQSTVWILIMRQSQKDRYDLKGSFMREKKKRTGLVLKVCISRANRIPIFPCSENRAEWKHLFSYSAVKRTARLHGYKITTQCRITRTHSPSSVVYYHSYHTPLPPSLHPSHYCAQFLPLLLLLFFFIFSLSPARLHFPLQNLSDNSSFSFSIYSSISSWC